MSTSRGIIVQNIPRGLSNEVIKQYFFSKGGEIAFFKSFGDGKRLLLEFKDSEVIAGILSCEHKIGRHVITVSSVDESPVDLVPDDTDTSNITVKHFLGDNPDEKDAACVQNPDEYLVVKTVEYKQQQWKVLSLAKIELLREIKDLAKSFGIEIITPKTQASVAKIELLGDIHGVEVIRQRLEDLKKMLYVSSVRLNYTPGLWRVLQSLEDKIRIIEDDNNVAFSIIATSSTNDDTVAGINQIVFTADLNCCHIQVCVGNFTRHSSATTIINVMEQDVDQLRLKELVKSGGKILYDDMIGRLNELSSCELPQVFETKAYKLNIKKLVHCVVLKWNEENEKEVHVLEEGFSRAIISSYPPCIVVSLLPILYPPVVVVDALLKAIERNASKIMGNTFVLYVANIHNAKVIQKCFSDKHIKFSEAYAQLNNYMGHNLLGNNISIRFLNSNLPTFLSVIKGDIFQQKVEACINSTNSDLDLSRGMLSKQLLKIMGPKLQEECNEYAPLCVGQVAVTSAENLLSEMILHIALPAYKSNESERILRETFHNVLQVCFDRKLTSIAIPSLGIGNLSYPHNIVADILITEVLGFNAKHPHYFEKVVFVLSEKEVYESFMKNYLKHLCICSKEGKEERTEGSEKESSTLLLLKHGRIEDECVDVIINPTNAKADLSINPVSQAISKKAGKSLQIFCSELTESGVIITEKKSIFTKASGLLRCKKILHVYTPTNNQANSKKSNINSILHSVVLDALTQAEKFKFEHLSLPLLGYGYPVEERAISVIEACLEFGQSIPFFLKQIILVVSKKSHYQKVCSCLMSVKAKLADTSPPKKGNVKGCGCVLDLQQQPWMGSKQPYSSSHPWRETDLKILNNKDAVINVYGVNAKRCSWIVQDIDSKVMKELVTEFIYDDFIQHFITSEIADINQHLDELGVSMVLKNNQKIMLSGEKNNVRDAQTYIVKVISSLKHANATLNQVVWQRKTENGIQIIPEKVSTRLEMALNKKVHWLELRTEIVCTVIDLHKMLETDLKSGKTYCIQRLEKMSQIELPRFWQLQPMEQGQENTCHMFTVSSDSEEYESALMGFKETMYGREFSIVNLKRIQNFNEYTKHCAFLDVLKRRYGGQVLLKRLFHGTSVHSVEAIAHQGFNRIFAADANAALFGKGVYFASCANYSAQEKYSVPDECGNQWMLICRVIVGKYTKGGKTMKVAPPLDPKGNKHLLFDTLVDDTANPTIYVVMSDSQAYAEYLVTFRSQRSK